MASIMKPLTRRASWLPPRSAWQPARSDRTRIVPAARGAAAARVRVSADRVIRSTVGLRPFRPVGFVVRAEKLDAKTVIHNYGHGGAGITLSWGTAQLAVDLAPRGERARVRRDRLRSGGAGHRAALAGARLLPDDLRSRNAADDHVQPGGRTVGAGLRLRSRARHARIPPPVRRGGAHCISPLPILSPASLWRALAAAVHPGARPRLHHAAAHQPEQRGGAALSGGRPVDRRPASFRCTVCSSPAHHADRTGDLPGRI